MKKLVLFACACIYGFSLYSMEGEDYPEKDLVRLIRKKSSKKESTGQSFHTSQAQEYTQKITLAYSSYKHAIKKMRSRRLAKAITAAETAGTFVTKIQKLQLLAQAKTNHKVHEDRLQLSMTAMWKAAENDEEDSNYTYLQSAEDISPEQFQTSKAIQRGEKNQKQYTARPNKQIKRECERACFIVLLIQDLKTS